MNVRAESLRPRDFVEKSQAARNILHCLLGELDRELRRELHLRATGGGLGRAAAHMAAMCCEPGAIAAHLPLEGKGGWAPGWWGTQPDW
jgi:hypothetical protein